jgi:hypothetical protein
MMAFPIVETTATYTGETLQLSHDVTLPTGIAQGDLLLVMIRVIDIPNTPTGWARYSLTSSGVLHYIYYKTAGASESSTLTLTFGTNRRLTALSYRISGWSDWTHQFVDANTLDPPSLTHGLGSGDILWLAIAAARPTNLQITTAPTDFSGFVIALPASSTSSDRMQVAGAQRNLTQATLDPGAFGATGSFTDANAWTIAILGADTARLGITITDIKEPNAADALVGSSVSVSNARVKVWYGSNDTGAEDEIHTGQTITSGGLEVELTGGTINGEFVATVDWDAGGGETKYFRTTGTIVDLDAV